MTNAQIDEYLAAHADEAYKAFNSRIVASKLPMLGVRLPAIKSLAVEVSRVPAYFDTACLATYEHIMLYGMALAKTRTIDLRQKWEYFCALMRKFDNWAHVDCIVAAFKQLGKERRFFYPKLCALATGGEFERRVLIVALMDYYLTDADLDETYRVVKSCEGQEPYVIKAEAWLISVGLVKFYDRTLEYLRQGYFCREAHNLGIQKARESDRISPEQKAELNALKIK